MPEAVFWQQQAGPVPSPAVILPDGCLDLIWDGERLLVAGPDTATRRLTLPAASRSAALRFSAGLGPSLLGHPADELRDRTVDLADLWAARPARELAEQVAAGPERALQSWLTARAADHPVDPLGPAVVSMAAAGRSVATMADQVGLGARQLNRRCQSLFGYGPRTLTRILRLGRALDEVRAHRPLAEVAAGGGYYDQAHLNREVRELTGTTPTRLLAELS